MDGGAYFDDSWGTMRITPGTSNANTYANSGFKNTFLTGSMQLGMFIAGQGKAFGMKINAIDVRPIEQEILDEIQPDFLGGPQDLDGAIKDCDFLSVHLHLTEDPKHIIDRPRIALLKPTSYGINVARGQYLTPLQKRILNLIFRSTNNPTL